MESAPSVDGILPNINSATPSSSAAQHIEEPSRDAAQSEILPVTEQAGDSDEDRAGGRDGTEEVSEGASGDRGGNEPRDDYGPVEVKNHRVRV